MKDTATETGKTAEDVVARHLLKSGYKILEQNWRSRWCEIDIVAAKQNIIWFIEVKYRQNESQGTGLDYITPKKIRQMNFAAELWVHKYSWDGDYRLAAVEVGGPNYEVGMITEL